MSSVHSQASSSAARPAAGADDDSTRPQHSPPALTTTELQRAFDRVLAGVVRGAAIGFTLRGGLHIVGSLLTALSKRRKRAITLSAAVEDTIRYTAFLASLAGVYIGTDEGIAALFGKER